MKKRDIILIIALVVLGLVSIPVVRGLSSSGGTGDVVRVYVGSQLYKTLPFGRDATLRVEQEGGGVNVIRVTEEGVFMASASCKNQLCVHQAPITRENLETRPTGPFIVCLPNKITVEVELGAS